MSPFRVASEGEAVLTLRAGGVLCALPLGAVEETCRPLPLRPLSGGPPWIRGATVLRGRPTPVVDLAAVLTGRGATDARGLVALRAGERRVALEVDDVLGVRWLSSEVNPPPPLLAEVAPDLVEALGLLDGELLVALGAGVRLPDEVWARLEAQGSA